MLRHIDMNAAGSGGAASPADTANVADQKEACIALIQALMNAALDRPPGDQATGFSQRMGQAAVNVLLKRDTRPREVHISSLPPPPPPGSSPVHCHHHHCLPSLPDESSAKERHITTDEMTPIRCCRTPTRYRPASGSMREMRRHLIRRWTACVQHRARL